MAKRQTDNLNKGDAKTGDGFTLIEGLTLLQSRFAYFYVQEMRGWRAAQMAGYKGSYDTLCSIASDNIRKPKIAAAIDMLLERQAMGKSETLARLADIARGDIRELALRPDGAPMTYQEMMQHPAARLIKRIRRRVETAADGTVSETVDMEMYPADAALEKLLRVHGLLLERADVTSGGLPLINADTLVQAMRRAREELGDGADG